MRARTLLISIAAGVAMVATHIPSSAAVPIAITACPFDVVIPDRTYVLQNDVTGCAPSDSSDSAIRIKANNVIVDLNGHVLAGNGTTEGAGIAQHDASSRVVTVRNGTVTGFSIGVELAYNRTRAVLSDVAMVRNAGYGLYMNEQNVITIRRSVAARNGTVGILASGRGSISSSQAVANDRFGLSFGGSGPNSLVAVTADGNTESGISLFADRVTVSRSQAVGNGHAVAEGGVLISGDQARITRSVVSGNHVSGIVFFEQKKAVVTRNTVDGNGWGDLMEFAPPIELPGGTRVSGRNVARGNADADCAPSRLCPKPFVLPKGAIQIGECDFDATEPGKTYVLTTNLECTSTNGINVLADGITVDLGNHTLAGGFNSTDGVRVDDSSGIKTFTLRNGAIQRFGDGVFSQGGTMERLTVRDVASVSNQFSGFRVNNAGIIAIDTSSAVRNGHEGIDIEGGGQLLMTSSQSVKNGRSGVFVDSGEGSRIIRSIVSANADDGIEAIGDGIVISRTTTNANGTSDSDRGMELTGSGITVSRSLASGNFFQGILVTGDEATISRNRVTGNGWGTADGQGTGIYNTSFTTAPVGTNSTLGNDFAACDPEPLCP